VTEPENHSPVAEVIAPLLAAAYGEITSTDAASWDVQALMDAEDIEDVVFAYLARPDVEERMIEAGAFVPDEIDSIRAALGAARTEPT
jgi:hypothetical protein